MQHVIPVDFAKFPQGFHSEILASPKSGVDSCYIICSRVEPGAGGPKLHAHPAEGAPLDTPVEIRHAKAFGQL
jgi:hypothetical protein